MTADEFKQHYLIYHEDLYRLAYMLTSNPNDAEDLLQDLYLKMWQLRDSVVGIDNREAFMATVMRRIYCDRLRAKQIGSVAMQLDDISDMSSQCDASYQVEYREQYEELENFISQLPSKEQRVIRLHLLEDRDYKEIGSVTGLTQGSIRVLVMRAKNKIKKRLKL